MAERAKARAWSIEERRAEVERLAVKGWSERRIARHLGVSKTTVHNDHEAILEELRESRLIDAEKIRALELEKLSECEAAALQTVSALSEADDSTTDGDGPIAGELILKAIDRVVKIQERRSKLLGLDSPEKIDANITGNANPETAARLVREAFRTEETHCASDGSGCQGDAPAAADGDG